MTCRRFQSRTTLLFGVLLVAALAAGTVGVVGATPAGVGGDAEPTVDTPSPTGGVLLQSVSKPANETTETAESPPPHRNPAEIEPSNSAAQLEAVLRGSIDGQLAGSIENLDEGQYELAREQLGEDFEATLRRYAELSDEFDATEQAELFSSLEADQEAYIDAVEAYETTRTEYESAAESGATTRRRQLKRELVTDAERVSTTGGRVVENYRELGNLTNQEFTDRINRVQQRRANATETATAVRSDFTETSLSVTANRSTVGFTDAIQLTGQIRTADGDPVGSQQAVITVGDRRHTVDVAADGRFGFVVQPSGVWADTDALRLSYRPPTESTLLGSNTTLPLSVMTTDTRVRIDSVSETASYDQPLVLNGTLLTTATGEPVPAAPVSIRADGVELSTTQTTSDGRFSFESSLPADLPADETTLTVKLRSSSRALAGTDAETTVRIDDIDPVISVTATAVERGDSEPRFAVDGRLTSSGGRPVAGESVTVSVDGEAVGDVSTDSEGFFRGLFAVPAGIDAGSEPTVEVTADLEASSLNAARESTTVALPETLFGSAGLSSDDIVPLGIGALVGFLGVLGGAGWWLRQSPAQRGLSDTAETTLSPSGDTIGGEDLLAVAVGYLNEGAHETATTIAYLAVRRGLRERVDAGETATHWEWYEACAAAGVDQLSELETLVAAFEQIHFAPNDGNSSAVASRAVDTARQFVDADG